MALEALRYGGKVSAESGGQAVRRGRARLATSFGVLIAKLTVAEVIVARTPLRRAHRDWRRLGWLALAMAAKGRVANAKFIDRSPRFIQRLISLRGIFHQIVQSGLGSRRGRRRFRIRGQRRARARIATVATCRKGRRQRRRRGGRGRGVARVGRRALVGQSHDGRSVVVLLSGWRDAREG